MSMFQRFWLALLVMGLMSFIGSLAISLVTARHYLAQQLYTQATDSANALALSMSQQSKDPVTIELQVSALFDNGHYQSVSFTSTDGVIQIERRQDGNGQSVPGWFEKLLPLAAPEARAQVSDGWQQAGTVSVFAHTRFAYESLWKGSQTLLILSAGVALLAGWLGSLFLRKVVQSMRAVTEQAQAIEERRFITVEEPSVPELKRVTHALNHMVERVRGMFEEESQRLADLRREASLDPVTGLANRNHFEAALAAELRDDEAANEGVLIRVQLGQLASINQRLGADATDRLLSECAGVLARIERQHSNALAGRLGGAEFAVLLPGLMPADAAGKQKELVGEITALLRRAELPFEFAVKAGRTPYQRNETASDVLNRAEQALHSGNGELAAVSSAAPVRNWRNDIERGLREHAFLLQTFAVFDRHGKTLHDEGLLRLSRAEGGEPEPAGRFMPEAARLGLLPDIDREVLRLGTEHVRQRNSALALNLSGELMRDQALREQLRAHLFRHPLQAPSLWLEMSETGFGVWHDRELAELAAFVNSLKPLGVRVGLKHVGRRFEKLPKLHELGLHYLKIDPAFAAGIETDRDHQSLVRAIVSVAHTLEMQVVAMGVNTRSEWDQLALLGVDGIGGPVTRTVLAAGEL